MKLRLKTAALAALLSAMPWLSQAAVVHSDYTHVSGSTWMADIAVVNDGSPAQITGFTIYFAETLFTNLLLSGSPATWDTLLIQPDTGLPAAGFLDSFAINDADAIGAGGSLGGFRVQFDYLGATVPTALSFDINDRAFNVVFSGTSQVTVVPEPGSLLLGSLALLGLAATTRRQRSPAPQSASEITA